MNLLDCFTKGYGVLQSNNKVLTCLLKPLRFFVRGVANNCLPKYLNRTDSYASKKTCEPIIISLTSFPARINNVWQVVECMFRQSIRPYKIFLWLSKEQFPKKEDIPLSLLSRENDIFNIRLVEGDIRSHKKYYYVSKEYKDSLIFLIDDDIYYPTDILEKSLNEYLKNPNTVVCNYGTQIQFDNVGRHKSYSHWISNRGSTNIFFGSGGGTLFKPKDLHVDLTNITLAYELTPTADDIWLNTMARLKGTRIILLSNKLILPIINSKSDDLSSVNNGLFKNDIQIEAIEKHYGRCFDEHK